MEEERLPLLAEEARRRNLGKRVKLHSKRLRQLWPSIASFLQLRDVVAVGSTCRRLQRLLESDRVWQNEYDRVTNQQVTKLLLPHVDSRFDSQSSTKEKLKRVIHARHVHDPTNAFQGRLREAEREAFQRDLWQSKVRSVVRANIPLVILLCCISVWSYSSPGSSAQPAVYIPPAQLRGAENASFDPMLVDPVKTFVLVTDSLLLVSLIILSIGDLTDKALYSVGVLLAIEVAVMMAEFVAWSSTLQVVHSFLVLAMVVVNIGLATKKRLEYFDQIAAFQSFY